MTKRYYVITEEVCPTCQGDKVIQHNEITCPECLGEGSFREEVELIRALCDVYGIKPKGEGKPPSVDCTKLRGLETS